MRTKLSKPLFTLLIAILTLSSFAQTNAELLSVQVSATIQTLPAPQITLDWINDGSGTGYSIYRRTSTASAWGAAVATLGSSANNYADNNVVVDHKDQILRRLEQLESEVKTNVAEIKSLLEKL